MTDAEARLAAMETALHEQLRQALCDRKRWWQQYETHCTSGAWSAEADQALDGWFAIRDLCHVLNIVRRAGRQARGGER